MTAANPDFRRFTPAARTAVVEAHEEARRLGHATVGAGHLLLALVAEQSGPVGGMMRESGVGFEPAKSALAGLAPKVPDEQRARGLAPELANTFEVAMREETEVTPWVLCVALLSTDNTASDVLAALGIDRLGLLARLRQRRTDRSTEMDTVPPLRDLLQTAVTDAEILANRVGREADIGDAVVALLADPDSLLARALAELGVHREQLEEALADARGPHASH